MIEKVFPRLSPDVRPPAMSDFSLPAVSAFPLDRSLHAVERIVAQSRELTDDRLKRSLLKAGCDLLDHALRCSERPQMSRRD